MTHSRNRHLVPFAVLAAALAGAATAYAASRSAGSPSSARLSVGYAASPVSSNRGGHRFGLGGRHGGDLAAAASYLGLTQAELTTQLEAGKTLAQVAAATSGKSAAGLIAALVAAEKTELAAAVTAGRLTQAQADRIAPRLEAHATAEVNGTRPARGPDGFGRSHRGDELTAAATYLGVTEAALTAELQAGKTLAQVAAATSGKSAAGLVDALVAAEKTELAAAVSAGTITQAQSDQIASRLTERFTALVNGTRPPHDGHRGAELRPGFRPAGAPAPGSHI